MIGRDLGLDLPFRKPLGTPRVNWQHPLSRGLIFATVLTSDGRPRDLIQGRTATGGPTAIRNTPEGQSLSFNGTSDACNFGDISQYRPGAQNFTIMAYSNPPAAGTTYGLASKRDGGTFQQISLAANMDSNGGPVSGLFGLFCYDGTNQLSGATTASVVNGAFHQYVGIRNTATTLQFYVDGVSQALSYNSQANTNYTSTTPLFIGAMGSTSAPAGGYLPGQISYVYIWRGRALSATEVVRLNKDPYVFLREAPRQEVWLFLAPSGTSVALTGATVIQATVAATGPLISLAGATVIQATVSATGPLVSLAAANAIAARGQATLTTLTFVLTGASLGQGSTTAALTVTGGTTVALSGATVAQGQVAATGPLVSLGTNAVAIRAQATATLVTLVPSGQSVGQGSTTATLISVIALSGASVGQALVVATGPLIRLSGQSLGQASASDPLALPTQIGTAVLGTPFSQLGRITLGTPVPVVVAAAPVALTGQSVGQASSTTTGLTGAGGLAALTGASVGQATVSAGLRVLLAGASVAQAQTSLVLANQAPLAGASVGQATVSAGLGVRLAGQSVGQAQTSLTLTNLVALSGQSAGQGSTSSLIAYVLLGQTTTQASSTLAGPLVRLVGQSTSRIVISLAQANQALFLIGQTVAQAETDVTPLGIYLPPNSSVTAQGRSTGALTVSLGVQSAGQASSTLAPVTALAGQASGQASSSAIFTWSLSGQPFGQASSSALLRVALSYPFPAAAIVGTTAQAQSTAGLSFSLVPLGVKAQATADATLSVTPVVGLSGFARAQASLAAGLSVGLVSTSAGAASTGAAGPQVLLSGQPLGQASSLSAQLVFFRLLSGQTVAQGSASGSLTVLLGGSVTAGASAVATALLSIQPLPSVAVLAQGSAAIQPSGIISYRLLTGLSVGQGATSNSLLIALAPRTVIGQASTRTVLLAIQPLPSAVALGQGSTAIQTSGIIFYRLLSGQTLAQGSLVTLAMDVDRREGTIDNGQVVLTGGSITRGLPYGRRSITHGSPVAGKGGV